MSYVEHLERAKKHYAEFEQRVNTEPGDDPDYVRAIDSLQAYFNELGYAIGQLEQQHNVEGLRKQKEYLETLKSDLYGVLEVVKKRSAVATLQATTMEAKYESLVADVDRNLTCCEKINQNLRKNCIIQQDLCPDCHKPKKYP